MKSRILLCLVSSAGLLLAAQPALAASAAVREMAGIMAHLSHYPSDAEKARLQGIVDSQESTGQERVLAGAIINLKHKAADRDKDRLRQLANDATAPAEVRDLAGIVLNISHKPGAEDKRRLEQMMQSP
ncbi:MAG TPA: hypothetical protein VGD24_10065 [Gallionella sp.]